MSLRRLAVGLQKVPWTITIAQSLFRLTRSRFTAGAVGVVVNEAGQVLIAEHVFHPHHPWGLPGGWVDRHENPAHAVLREIREELQLSVEVGPVVLVENVEASHLDFAYLCKPVGEVGKLCSELLDYRWADPQDLPRMYSFHEHAITAALRLSQLKL